MFELNRYTNLFNMQRISKQPKLEREVIMQLYLVKDLHTFR